jgi:hypothetical protein
MRAWRAQVLALIVAVVELGIRAHHRQPCGVFAIIFLQSTQPSVRAPAKQSIAPRQESWIASSLCSSQ